MFVVVTGFQKELSQFATPMDRFLVFVVCLVGFGANAEEVQHLPEYLKEYACRQSDPEFSKCLSENFQKALPVLVKGVPELDIPPLDPFVLPHFIINRSYAEEIQVIAEFDDFTVTGLSGVVLEDFKADPYKYTAQGRYRVPELHVSTEYKVAGVIFGTPLYSEGHFEGTFSDIVAFLKGSAQLAERNGEKYFKADQIRFKFKLGGGHISLTTHQKNLQENVDLLAALFNNNPSGMADAVQTFLMENDEYDFIKDILNQQLAKVPAKEYLPE